MKYWPPVYNKGKATCSLPHHENERQQSINDFWLSIFGNLSCEWLKTLINGALAAYVSQKIPAYSLPHQENECQPSVNDFWSGIFSNISGARS